MKKLKLFWNDIDPARRKIIKPIIGIIAGGILGYTYYATVGCASGTCPITSNPFISTVWGAAIGGLSVAG